MRAIKEYRLVLKENEYEVFENCLKLLDDMAFLVSDSDICYKRITDVEHQIENLLKYDFINEKHYNLQEKEKGSEETAKTVPNE